MKNIRESKEKMSEMRMMIREKHKSKCPKLIDKMNKRLNVLSSYTKTGQMKYSRKLDSLNIFYKKLHETSIKIIEPSQHKKAVLHKPFIEFKKKFSKFKFF